MKKRSIILCAKGSDSWIGGVYYVKNVAYSLSLNRYLTDKYNIIFIADNNMKDLIGELPENIQTIWLKI